MPIQPRETPQSKTRHDFPNKPGLLGDLAKQAQLNRGSDDLIPEGRRGASEQSAEGDLFAARAEQWRSINVDIQKRLEVMSSVSKEKVQAYASQLIRHLNRDETTGNTKGFSEIESAWRLYRLTAITEHIKNQLKEAITKPEWVKVCHDVLYDYDMRASAAVVYAEIYDAATHMGIMSEQHPDVPTEKALAIEVRFTSRAFMLACLDSLVLQSESLVATSKAVIIGWLGILAAYYRLGILAHANDKQHEKIELALAKIDPAEIEQDALEVIGFLPTTFGGHEVRILICIADTAEMMEAMRREREQQRAQGNLNAAKEQEPQIKTPPHLSF